MKKTIKLLTVAALLGLALPASAEGDAAKGRFKADTCLGCHNVDSYTNAYPSYHVPKLWGQHSAYLVSALQAYKAGKRNHPTMQAQASSLSDEDMQDIATFFSTKGQ